jgi:hypothetical protein
LRFLRSASIHVNRPDSPDKIKADLDKRTRGWLNADATVAAAEAQEDYRNGSATGRSAAELSVTSIRSDFVAILFGEVACDILVATAALTQRKNRRECQHALNDRMEGAAGIPASQQRLRL